MDFVSKQLERYPLIFWLFLFVLTLILRVSTFYTPILDVDETQFAGFAHVLMDGGLPYVDSLDTKPLGIYLFYWLCFEIFGRFNMLAVHVVTALVTFAASYFLYGIFSNFDKKQIGRWAALFFIVFSTTFIPKYLATSINSIMVFFLILSVYFMARAEVSLRIRYDLLAGLVLGFGFLFKYTAGIQLVLFLGYTLLSINRNWVQFLKRNIIFGIAFMIPFAVHGLFLYKLGVWGDYVQWSLLGSGSYISQGGSTISFWQSLFIRFGTYVLATLFLWVFLVRALKEKIFSNRLNTLFFLWFVLSLIPVCIGGRFYSHYFIPLLPSLCGLAAIGFKVKSNALKWVTICLIIAPVIFFWGLRLDHRTYLTYFPDDEIYEQQLIGEKLKELSHPNDKIFVWGFATGIYFHSELKPSSRFLWSDQLTGRTPGPSYARVNLNKEHLYKNPKAWEAFWQDLKKNQPQYFVDTSPANLHDYKRFPVIKYPELYSYLTENYDKVENIMGVEIYKRKGNRGKK